MSVSGGSRARRWWGHAAALASVLAEAAVVVLVVAAVLEGGSRLVHGNVRPMLPYVPDEALGPRMPGGFESKVAFSGQPFSVCTDRFGLRRASCDAPLDAPPVLTVGDSQAFGWAMDFGQTFTAQVARRLGEAGNNAAGAMAAGGADVESLLRWAQDFRRSAGAAPEGRLNIVMVNLGNDLDEMYYGRSRGEMPYLRAARDWLTVHSFFMLDFGLLKTRLAPSSQWQFPPGANPVVLTLSPKEREHLASATAQAALRLLRALPPARQSVVVLLPNDYQVARSEFTKYQSYYPSQDQYQGWLRRVDASAAGLDAIEQGVAAELRAAGAAVVVPRQALAQHDPVKVFDRKSHHLSVEGQQVLAAAIVAEVSRGTSATTVAQAAAATVEGRR